MERKIPKNTMSSIRAKLVSAVAMLLVAVTMVVSSTYAWFTLSTAPEVSGITTAIGANGALEIRLNNTASTGDVNATPGNIVDLATGYGLDKITLMPSALNSTDGTIDERFLLIPQYSENGRPSADLTDERTEAGVYDGSSFFANSGVTGVRAVGVSSGLTDRQYAYRNAKYAATSYSNQAATKVATSLNTNGSILGNIVIKKGTVANATYTPAEVAALGNIITDLEQAIVLIETAYKEMIVALAASALITGDGSDAAYSTIRANFENNTLKLEDIVSSKSVGIEGFSVSIDGTALLTALTALQGTKANVKAARDAHTAIGTKDSYDWTELSTILNKLMVIEYTKLNGKEVKVPQDEEEKNAFMSDLANSIMNEGIKITLENGSGAYEEIADHCGDFSANVTMTDVKAGGFTFEKLTASMSTKTNTNPSHLNNAAQQVVDAHEPEGTSGQATPMTEFYGFIVDLAFKTNAASSNLLLQTTPVDRIYEDNNNELTQGKGSYMTYKATTTELTSEQIKALMACVRIVFFETDSREVIAEARLDTANATIDQNGVTAKMYMYKNGVLQKEEGADTAITALDQNVEKEVSVLVYLDGATIKNEHVAATNVQSVVGSMNIQFASDADLKPMEYGDLHTPNKDTNN